MNTEKSAIWFRSCHLAHNLSTLTWTKKTALEERQERTRQGEEGTLVFLNGTFVVFTKISCTKKAVFVPLDLEFVMWVTTSYLHRRGQRRPS